MRMNYEEDEGEDEEAFVNEEPAGRTKLWGR